MFNHLAIFFQIFTLPKSDVMRTAIPLWYTILLGCVMLIIASIFLIYLTFQYLSTTPKKVVIRYWKIILLIANDFLATGLGYFTLDTLAKKEAGDLLYSGVFVGVVIVLGSMNGLFFWKKVKGLW